VVAPSALRSQGRLVRLPDFQSLHGSRTALITASIAAVIVGGVAALLVFTDLRLFLASAIWIAPVVVLIPFVFPAGAQRAYGLRTVIAALVLPAITSIWVVWLVLGHGVIGHHP
jgi:hypothetical protein